MFEFTVPNLVRLGYSETMAAHVVAMTPAERIGVLQICGNAWQDMPMFQTIHDVLENDASDMTAKRIALLKSWLTVGETPKVGLTDEQVLAEIADWLKIVKQ